jgi:hypothetical protein
MVCDTRPSHCHMSLFFPSFLLCCPEFNMAQVSLISVKQEKYSVSLRYMYQARKGNDPSAHMKHVTTRDCSNHCI